MTIWWVLPIAILVAIIVWGIGETPLVKFQPGLDDIPMPGGGTLRGISARSRVSADIKEVLLRTTMLGGLLGFAVGLGGAISQRRLRIAIIAPIVGLILGALASAAPVWPLMRAYTQAEDAGPGELTRAVLLHLGLWLPIGAAAGLSLALGLGTPRRIGLSLLGGLIGVAAGTLLYEIVGSVLYPLAETGAPIALAWQPRLLAPLLVALGATIGAATVIRVGKPKPEHGPAPL